MSDDILAEAQEMVRRLLNEHDAFSGHAADIITALLARIAAQEAQLREMALDVLAASGQAQEAYEAQLAAEAERAETYAYAKHLAEAIFAKGQFNAPQCEPREDTLGVLTQIDNMVAGILASAAIDSAGTNEAQTENE